ncbi:hypothetical protein I6E84_07240 [Psychrobacter sp. SCQQ22]|uniref:hypothetical protein n=1 Tax=Psychrobacter sp. SCQQ22 TaxID=2792059 RepID=UPI0018CF1D2A|nr:hypothetical protein [Psychrobacter sp. SCQQ22]MBH0086010.1 hypothetical protein [Psychrobacter sp. SCQQ22]
MKAMTVAAVLTLMAVTTSTQAEVYQWQDDLCDMKGEFNNRKYSAKQIENSHFMLNNLTSVQLSSSSPLYPRDIDQISKSDLDNLNQEYQARKRKVEQLEVVPQAQTYKRELLKSIDGEYVLNKLTILAYLDPLQAMRLSPPMCKQYLAPFFKDEAAVQNKWQEFVEEQIQEQTLFSNDDGKYSRNLITERYQRQQASDPENYAKINLLTYGFSNCVNDQIYHADSEKVFKDSQKLNETLFGKSLKMVCEEP